MILVRQYCVYFLNRIFERFLIHGVLNCSSLSEGGDFLTGPRPLIVFYTTISGMNNDSGILSIKASSLYVQTLKSNKVFTQLC